MVDYDLCLCYLFLVTAKADVRRKEKNETNILSGR